MAFVNLLGKEIMLTGSGRDDKDQKTDKTGNPLDDTRSVDPGVE